MAAEIKLIHDLISEIDESIRLDEGRVLPVTGWYELLDELGLQVRLSQIS